MSFNILSVPHWVRSFLVFTGLEIKFKRRAIDGQRNKHNPLNVKVLFAGRRWGLGIPSPHLDPIAQIYFF
jgi:hypothetical protein